MSVTVILYCLRSIGCCASACYVCFRLSDILVVGHRFYRNSIFCLLFSSSTLARRTKLNKNRPHAQKWVRFENVCPKFGVYPHTKPPFSTTSQLNGNFNGLYLGNETCVHNRAKALEITRGLLHRLKMSYFGPQGSTNDLKLDLHFCSPSVILHINSLPGFTDGDQQTNSTKPCQTVDSKSPHCANNLP